MRSFLTGILCLPLLASAAPTLSLRDVSSSEPLNVTYSSSTGNGTRHNSALPNVLILATGGTIAGASSSSTDDTVSAQSPTGIEIDTLVPRAAC